MHCLKFKVIIILCAIEFNHFVCIIMTSSRLPVRLKLWKWLLIIIDDPFVDFDFSGDYLRSWKYEISWRNNSHKRKQNSFWLSTNYAMKGRTSNLTVFNGYAKHKNARKWLGQTEKCQKMGQKRVKMSKFVRILIA